MDRYEQYLDDVRYEIARMIELRRNRSLSRPSFWGPRPSTPSTSSTATAVAATATEATITNAPIDESAVDNEYRVNVKAEIRKINSRIEALSSKHVPRKKQNRDEFDEITQHETKRSQAIPVPLDIFTIDGDGDLEEADFVHQYSGAAPQEYHEMQIEEEVEVTNQANCFKDCLKVSLVIVGLLTVAIFMGCIYKSVMAAKHSV